MKSFFQVLKKRMGCAFICFIVIIPIIIFFTCIKPGVCDLVAHNAVDTSIIGIEMMCESGPNFKSAAEHHINMLQKYATHMENKSFGSVLRNLYGEYAPVTGVEKALKTLEKAKNSDQINCAKAIWLAGEQVEQYRMKAEAFSKGKLSLHKYQQVPGELVCDIRTKLDESRNSFNRFEETPTLENAVFLCEDNRRTILLLFLARAGYNNGHKKLFDEFHELEEKAIAKEQKLFDELPTNSPDRKLLKHIIESEQRRRHILEILKTGDMNKVRTLMWETIEIAYYERPTILEVAAAPRINFGERWKRPTS